MKFFKVHTRYVRTFVVLVVQLALIVSTVAFAPVALANTIVVQDDWSGTGSIDGTSPDIGPVSETWDVVAGTLVRNSGELDLQSADLNIAAIETSETDVIVESNVLLGGGSGGGGHAGVAARINSGSETWVAGVIAEDCGVCIATSDAGFTTIAQAPTDTIDSSGTVTISQGTSYDLTLTTDGNTITFTVAEAGGDYVTIQTTSTYNNTETTHGIRAWGGGGTVDLPMTMDTLTISTPDTTNPTVSTLSPTDNATGVSVGTNLVITFDEAVDVESGDITIYESVGDAEVEAIDVTSGQVTGTGTTTITINPSSDLDFSTEYYVQIDATAFDDTSGNSYAGISDTTSWSFTTGALQLGTYLRLDRMKASTATGGTVCHIAATAGTEASVQVTFPTGFTVNGTAGNWTVTTTNLPDGATAWPSVDTASGVSSQTVTFPSGDLTVGTLYCFNFASSSTLTTSTAGSDKAGTIVTRTSAPANIDSVAYATAVISEDQITISATVPPTFSFALSATSDSFASNLSSSAVVSTAGIDVTIGTNAANGWIAWLKSANAGLDSATTSDSVDTSGTVNDACTELVEGSDFYQLAVEIDTDSGTGTGTVAVDDEYNCDHDGDPWTGGTFSSTYEEIGTADGTTDGDIITLYGLATISAVKPAATDYTDTWTVVGAGLF